MSKLHISSGNMNFPNYVKHKWCKSCLSNLICMLQVRVIILTISVLVELPEQLLCQECSPTNSSCMPWLTLIVYLLLAAQSVFHTIALKKKMSFVTHAWCPNQMHCMSCVCLSIKSTTMFQQQNDFNVKEQLCIIQQGKDQKAVQADKESSVIYWKADNIKPSWLRSSRKSTGEQEWGRNVFQVYRFMWLEHKHWQSGRERDRMGRLYCILQGW